MDAFSPGEMHYLNPSLTFLTFEKYVLNKQFPLGFAGSKTAKIKP
jgi:hypothetical protein